MLTAETVFGVKGTRPAQSLNFTCLVFDRPCLAQVRCGIELDERLRVWQAADVARQAKTEIELKLPEVCFL